MPVPQANVLQSRLVRGRIGCGDGGLCGELLLREAVEPIGLAGELDVVGDEGLLADELVGFDDKVRGVRRDQTDGDVTDGRGSDGEGDAAAGGLAEGVCGGDGGAEEKRNGNEELAGDGDVGVGIGGAVEDGVVVQQGGVAGDEDVQGQYGQQESHGQGEVSPGARAIAETLLVEGAGSTGQDQEEYGYTNGRK